MNRICPSISDRRAVVMNFKHLRPASEILNVGKHDNTAEKHQTGNKKECRRKSAVQGLNSDVYRTHVANKQRRKSLFRHDSR